MKKILALFILLFSLLGCTNMQVGQTVKKNNLSYLKLTNNDLFFIKDEFLLDKYYSVAVLVLDDNVLTGGVSLLTELRYYNDKGIIFALFKDFRIGLNSTDKLLSNLDERFACLEELVFSNKEKVVSLKITNFSNIRDSEITNTQISYSQAKKLYEIMSSSKPLTVRVVSNLGYKDVKLNEDFKIRFKEFLEVPLKLKSYDVE